MPGAQRWGLLLTSWTLRVRRSETGLGKWEFKLVDPSVVCLCHRGHSSWACHASSGGLMTKLANWPSHFCLLSYLTPFLGWAGAFWWACMCDTNISTLCAYSDLSSHMPLSQNNLIQSPSPFPSRRLPGNLCVFSSQAMSGSLFSAPPIGKLFPFYCF